MKKFKVSLVAVLALIFGIAGSAFTTHSVKQTGQIWYALAANADPTQTDNYSPADGDPGCTGDPDVVCGILVNDNGDHPSSGDLSAVKSASMDFTQANANVEYKP
jgi:hypothetical protein